MNTISSFFRVGARNCSTYALNVSPFMAPSSTKGAVTRLLRNAAMNVTVFQFPCSTFWTSRSPCGARPYRRVIVVDTLVSSMNTSLLGSSLFCRRCNALRAAATSGRSCSAARKLFFKGQLQMMQKPRDRRLSDRDLFLRQSIFEFGQRDVRLLRYQLPHQILVRRQREIFIAAEFGRVDAARLPVKLEEADDRADADPALLRGFRDRGPALDRLDRRSGRSGDTGVHQKPGAGGQPLGANEFVALIGHLQVANKCRIASAILTAASSGPIPKAPALPGDTYLGMGLI